MVVGEGGIEREGKLYFSFYQKPAVFLVRFFFSPLNPREKKGKTLLRRGNRGQDTAAHSVLVHALIFFFFFILEAILFHLPLLMKVKKRYQEKMKPLLNSALHSIETNNSKFTGSQTSVSWLRVRTHALRPQLKRNAFLYTFSKQSGENRFSLLFFFLISPS